VRSVFLKHGTFSVLYLRSPLFGKGDGMALFTHLYFIVTEQKKAHILWCVLLLKSEDPIVHCLEMCCFKHG
jgi:hypothetical protein